MNKYDLEHKLLRGSPLKIGNIPSYKITLGDMDDFGFTKIQNIIYLLCTEDEKASEFFTNSDERGTTFLFIMATILNELDMINEDNLQDENIKNLLYFSVPSFLSIFFRKEVVFNPNYGFVIGDEGEDKFILNDSNYDEFRNILKYRNCLMDTDNVDDVDNPSNEMARKLLEKRRELRKKLKKSKKNTDDENEITLADLISIFAEAEKMPLQSIYDNYDIYQFNNQFNRLKIMDDYHVSIQSLIAGAKKEDVNYQHWLSKIKVHED